MSHLESGEELLPPGNPRGPLTMTLFESLKRSLALAGIIGLAACTEDLSSVPTNQATVVNVGLESRASALAGEGDVWLFAVRESESGGVDLDGDGDDFDAVLYVQNLARGTARNTGQALEGGSPPLGLAVGSPLAAFPASELATGGRDQNGDGDAGDLVMQVHDARTGTTRSLGLAVSGRTAPVIADGLVAFTVNEAAQGQDLDGDPLTASEVLHVYDSATNEVVNTRLVIPGRIFLANGSVAFLEQETTVDLNGDGDALDRVLRLFDLASETLVETGLASDGSEPLLAEGVWLVAVPEFDQGEVDLDGDGDTGDVVFEVFDPCDSSVTNLEVASIGPGSATTLTLRNGQRFFAFVTLDSLAPFLFFYLPDGPFLVSTDVPVAALPVVAGNFADFLVIEAVNGRDWNDDGDTDDLVAFQFDPRTLHVANQELDAFALFGSERFLLLARPESTSAIDWNEDGDLDDVVVQLFDPLHGSTINTAIAAVDVFGADDDEVLLYVSEASENTDLNVDGDLDDEVFVLYVIASARTESLRVAGSTGFERFARLGKSGVVFLGDETAQRQDLNGDGDRRDTVWHRAK